MERRLHTRFNIYLPLSFFGRDSRGKVINGSGITVNVSDGGAFFLSRDSRLKPGMRLEVITITHPAREGPHNINISATVLRVEQLTRNFLGNSGEIGVAIRFENLLDFDAILGRRSSVREYRVRL